jgi:hypothetical protein
MDMDCDVIGSGAAQRCGARSISGERTPVIRRERQRNWHNLHLVSRHCSRTPNVSFASAMVGAPAVLGASDPGSTRLVYAMVAGLVVIGLAFIGLGVWLIRQTRYDPPVLAPLERMGDRDWRRRDGMTQRRILDEVRPEGAEPLRSQPDVPELDAEFELSEHPVSSMTDLGPGLSAPLPGSFPVPIAPPPARPLPESPVEESSVEEGRVEESSVEEARVEESSVEEGRVEDAQVDDSPAVDGQVEDGPMEDDPVDGGPVIESSAVERAAVEGSPESADR